LNRRGDVLFEVADLLAEAQDALAEQAQRVDRRGDGVLRVGGVESGRIGG
jgi:hypothetical protein